jgi:pimeloyl-ACP methyl ester carboxylesterase
MLTNIVQFGSEVIVVFLHGMNYYGAMFHHEGTEEMRKILSERKISHALFYKAPNVNSLEEYYLSFLAQVVEHKITQPMVLIGHSAGGTYARYIAKRYPVKCVVSLDSSFYEEFVNTPDPTDAFRDPVEDQLVTPMALAVGDIAENEYAFFYEAKSGIDTYQICEMKPRYYHIYTNTYSHSLHMRPDIARAILDKSGLR